MSGSGVVLFSGDDAAYHQWLRDNPIGLVVNTRRKRFDPAYLVLHRATCGYVTREAAPGAYTERDYAKICSDIRSELVSYLARKTGRVSGFSNECRCCENRRQR
jgi:hypothetical protein